MHDNAVAKGPGLKAGITLKTESTLLDRAIRFLDSGPAASEVLAHDVLGLAQTSTLIADRVVVALLGADPRVSRLGDGRWTLVATPTGSPLIEDCTFAVVDVETTGSGSIRGDRITEIGIVVVKGDSWNLAFESLVDPEQPISWRATEITRITQADVTGQPTFREIADAVAGELAGRVFVAHNVAFDWRFVNSELRRSRNLTLEGPRLCTAKLARRVISGLKSRKLDSIAQYFGVEIENRHRAAGDAVATAQILIRMIELARESGARTLEDLVRLRKKGRRKKTSLPRPMEEM